MSQIEQYIFQFLFILTYLYINLSISQLIYISICLCHHIKLSVLDIFYCNVNLHI